MAMSVQDSRLFALEACNTGNLAMLADVISAGASPLQRDPKTGSAGLHLAARGGYLDCADFLLSNKLCPVNIRNDIGNTPLHHAAVSGSKLVALRLLEAEADINAKNNMGQTPLHGAAGAGWDHVIECLASYRRPVCPLCAKDKCRKHILDINAQDSNGRTALHCTGKHLSGSTFTQLVSLGADRTLADQNGALPVPPAQRVIQLTTIALLLLSALVAALAILYPRLYELET